MKIVHGGYTEEEDRLSFKPIVFSNCITQMIILAEAAQKQKLSFDNLENEKAVHYLLELHPEDQIWTTEMGIKIKRLWSDSAIQKVYNCTTKKLSIK